MKFAHLADTHLGYRQFGLIEREEDFYEVFDQIINKIIEEKVDFVIHSGDLFETPRPTPWTLLNFQKALLKLKGAGIPMYVVSGNHDTVYKQNSIPPQVIFKKLGLKVISPINTDYVHDDVFIGGLPFYSKSRIDEFKNKLKAIAKKAEKYEKSILVLHQGIDIFLPMQYELEIGDIPENFDYYAFGHIHNYIKQEFGKGYLVYPGSTEIWKVNEISDFKKNGKGFVIVDLDEDKPVVDRIVINSPRKFIRESCDASDLGEKLYSIKKEVKDLELKPILSLDINNVVDDASDFHDLVFKELGDYCLNIRLRFNPFEDVEELKVNTSSNSLAIKDFIVKYLEDYDDEKVNNLALDLYEYLAKNKNEAVESLIDSYFKGNYDLAKIDDKEEI